MYDITKNLEKNSIIRYDEQKNVKKKYQIRKKRVVITKQIPQ